MIYLFVLQNIFNIYIRPQWYLSDNSIFQTHTNYRDKKCIIEMFVFNTVMAKWTPSYIVQLKVALNTDNHNHA